MSTYLLRCKKAEYVIHETEPGGVHLGPDSQTERGAAPETNAPAVHGQRDSQAVAGPGAQSSGPEVHGAHESQRRTGSGPPIDGQAGESRFAVKANGSLVRRLPKFSDDATEWIDALSAGDTIVTPFGCGSDKLVYCALAKGVAVKCCIPRHVKDCDTDEQFFVRLLSVSADDWYALRQIDANRLRIKILASVRLSIQKDRIRLGNRYGQYVQDLELLAGNPVGRTYKKWSQVTEGMHTSVMAVENEVTKSLARALKGDPVYERILKPVRGIGPAISGYLIGAILRPDRFPGIRSLWHYAGLHVEEDKDGNGHAPKRRRGVSGSWNPDLKRLCLGVIPVSWFKLGGEYYQIYSDRKALELERNPDIKKGHADRRARRYAVKLFLKRLWQQWRELEAGELVEEETA